MTLAWLVEWSWGVEGRVGSIGDRAMRSHLHARAKVSRSRLTADRCSIAVLPSQPFLFSFVLYSSVDAAKLLQ